MVTDEVWQALNEVFTPQGREQWLTDYYKPDAFKTRMARDLLAAAYVRRLCIDDLVTPCHPPTSTTSNS